MLTRNKLYTLILIACVAGYAWLSYSVMNEQSTSSFDGCLIKHVTDIPCPSCGATRSVISLMRGNFIEALYINPIGIIVAGIMLITPFWILFDLYTMRSTLFIFYQKTESNLRRLKYALPLILLVMANWVWNIMKGL